MSSIEMFISKLTNDLNLLEERKRTVELKIQELTVYLIFNKLDEN